MTLPSLRRGQNRPEKGPRGWLNRFFRRVSLDVSTLNDQAARGLPQPLAEERNETRAQENVDANTLTFEQGQLEKTIPVELLPVATVDKRLRPRPSLPAWASLACLRGWASPSWRAGLALQPSRTTCALWVAARRSHPLLHDLS